MSQATAEAEVSNLTQPIDLRRLGQADYLVSLALDVLKDIDLRHYRQHPEIRADIAGVRQHLNDSRAILAKLK